MVTMSGIKFSPVSIDERSKLDFRAGDTIRVWQKVKEGDKTRLQAFEGFVIARKHGREPGATFTIRKISGGIGVERIFPIYSPNIEKIELVKRAKVRRAKLYYVREKAAKAIRRKMKQVKIEERALLDEAQRAEKEAQKAKEAEEALRKQEAKKEKEEKSEMTEKGEQKTDVEQGIEGEEKKEENEKEAREAESEIKEGEDKKE